MIKVRKENINVDGNKCLPTEIKVTVGGEILRTLNQGRSQT